MGISINLQPRTYHLSDGDCYKESINSGALAVSQSSSFCKCFFSHRLVPCCQSALRIPCFSLSLNCQANLKLLGLAVWSCKGASILCVPLIPQQYNIQGTGHDCHSKTATGSRWLVAGIYYVTTNMQVWTVAHTLRNVLGLIFCRSAGGSLETKIPKRMWQFREQWHKPEVISRI